MFASKLYLMKNTLIFLLTFFVSIFAILSTNAQADKATLIKKMEQKIPEFLAQKKVPGMAIAVIDNGKVIYQNGYGYADLATSKPITTQTGFNIGSISKLFTAFGILKLVENGKIDLDAPVETYLTRWKLPSASFDKNKVSIRALLNHTAGISVHGYPGFTDRKSLPSLEASLNGNNGSVRADEKVEIILEPQTAFKYSGGGYTILQLVIEEVTQMTFERYMKKEIFVPLQMKNTSFKISKKLLKRAAIPYDKEKRPLPFEYFTAQAAAGLQTTLEDFIRFADDVLQESSIVTKSTLQEMLRPTAVSSENYGLGFRILKLGPMLFKGHAGSNTGWESAFFMDFETKSGLIMMTNGNEGAKALQNTLRTWAMWKYKE